MLEIFKNNNTYVNLENNSLSDSNSNNQVNNRQSFNQPSSMKSDLSSFSADSSSPTQQNKFQSHNSNPNARTRFLTAGEILVIQKCLNKEGKVGKQKIEKYYQQSLSNSTSLASHLPKLDTERKTYFDFNGNKWVLTEFAQDIVTKKNANRRDKKITRVVRFVPFANFALKKVAGQTPQQRFIEHEQEKNEEKLHVRQLKNFLYE